MSYYDELQDKRWSVKRKKIMRRDGWQCTVCSSKKTLVVHHTYYREGLKPWEYPDDSLLTLCHDCHHKYHTEHELTIVNITKPHPVRSRQKRKPKVQIERKKKPRITPLTKIQADRPQRFRRKVDGKWIVFMSEPIYCVSLL